MKLLPLVLLLSSCTLSNKDWNVALGGKGAYSGRDFSVTWDNEKSFGDAALAGTAIAGLYYGAANLAEEEATTRAVNSNATKEAINANNNATKLGSEGIKAGVDSEAIQKGAPLLPR